MTTLKPPSPKRISHITEVHGVQLSDPYFWLRDKENPEVKAHLDAENAYAQAVLAPTHSLREEIFEEMKGRIPPEDESVPVEMGGYLYYSKDLAGQQYKVRCRRKGSMQSPEEVLLDENEWAKGKSFFSLGVFEVSPDHTLLAFAFDQDGSEHQILKFKDLRTGVILADEIRDVSHSGEWDASSQHFFFTRLDEHDRPYQVLRHQLGSAHDPVVYEERDSKFFVSISKSKNQKWLLIGSAAMTTSEYYCLEADRPLDSFRVVEPRRHGIEYGVEHHGDHFLIVTNDQAKNFKLVCAPTGTPGANHWRDVISHNPEVLIQDVEPFRDHILLSVRERGMSELWILDPQTWKPTRLPMSEQAYVIGSMSTPDFDSTYFRFSYQSMTTPPTVYDQDFKTANRVLRKQRRIPSGYDASQYQTSRIFAVSHDGTQVPVNLVYRKDTILDGSAPCVLYGYGSYGSTTDPMFSAARISLLDRGFVYALAQLRGGSEMGRSWYEDGKFLKKKNTFYDFVACAEKLIQARYSSARKIAIYGGSAGGLLVGATLNLRPELFGAAVARVPFVDVMNTMLDETLPLTPIEFDEWGNPKDKVYFDYMLTYSPYDNVEAKAYPPLLVTAGFNDPRVTYWEPAKWCAKLRDLKTDANPVLLHVEMGAGHGGASGRFDSLKEEAMVYAFLLSTLKS